MLHLQRNLKTLKDNQKIINDEIEINKNFGIKVWNQIFFCFYFEGIMLILFLVN